MPDPKSQINLASIASEFTIGSDPSGSASIAAITGLSVIKGLVSVQRFVTGGTGYRGYRQVSSPGLPG